MSIGRLLCASDYTSHKVSNSKQFKHGLCVFAKNSTVSANIVGERSGRGEA